MNVALVDKGHTCRLILEGEMTFAFARYMEDRIIDALRRYRRIEVDLAGVSEIDLCGIHLLGVLQTVGGEGVHIVANSPVVEQGAARLLASGRGHWLRAGAREPVKGSPSSAATL
jgi:anti-anti-sigma regulatory factor